jgi:hypothetical protein
MTTIKGSESGATARNRMSKSIVLAIRLLMRQNAPDASSRDLAAYVVLALEKISESVENKRGCLGKARLLAQGGPLSPGVGLVRTQRGRVGQGIARG